MRAFMGVDMRSFLKSSKFLFVLKDDNFIVYTSLWHPAGYQRLKLFQNKAKYNDIPEPDTITKHTDWLLTNDWMTSCCFTRTLNDGLRSGEWTGLAQIKPFQPFRFRKAKQKQWRRLKGADVKN